MSENETDTGTTPDDVIAEAEATEAKDTIIQEAVDTLRTQVGLTKEAFKSAFGDLNVTQQHKALKALASIPKAKVKNAPILPVPTGTETRSPFTGQVSANGKNVRWDLPITKLVKLKHE